jgi:hypothetical protein
MCRLGNGSGGVFAPAAIEWMTATGDGDGLCDPRHLPVAGETFYQ